MIAYLFFHHLAADGDATGYEDGLRRFHAALAGAGIPGFVSSRTYRVGDGYCDWYLVQASAVLDVLNDAAVTGERSTSHAAVARNASDFAGKLLKHVAGADGSDAKVDVRFSKPRGMSYPDLYRLLQQWTNRPDVGLWRRMMVLGPPPEFSLLAPSEIVLPEELDPQVFRLEAV
ncbi:MAG TPA: hypothetical protein VKE27_01675 [Candidatus Dormibacteraeota bacterium]|nr:hypothetical protein [Candidatus Dormibacteraeota bacterium]